MAAKKAMAQPENTISQNLVIKILWYWAEYLYFYRILNYENFKKWKSDRWILWHI